MPCALPRNWAHEWGEGQDLRHQHAGDDAGGTLGEVEDRHQGLGEAGGLVGDHAPFQATRFEGVEQIEDAGKGLRVAADVGGVQFQELLAHGREIRVVRRHAEGHAQHPPRARARHVSVIRQGQRRHAAVGAHLVRGGAQVGRAVDQGAVQVEQHRLHLEHHAAAFRVANM